MSCIGEPMVLACPRGPFTSGPLSKGRSMQPDIQLNYWAILAAVAASMVIGFLWYGPILGKAWMKEMGWPADHKPAQDGTVPEKTNYHACRYCRENRPVVQLDIRLHGPPFRKRAGCERTARAC